MVIAKAEIRRIIKGSTGARVSEGAIDELGAILEQKGADISSMALGLAKHAGRGTIKAEDIALAFKSL